jgi:hypothetical protein
MRPAARRLALDVNDSLRSFAVTWDYRCPFARNAHEHVVTALRGGAPWDVTFVPFSLGQAHVAEGEPDIWSRWREDTGLLALQAGVVVRDKFPEQFLDVHDALFALRHDHAGQLRDEAAVRSVLLDQGVDADAVLAEIDGGSAILTVQQEHERAAFVRLMDRPGGDVAHATRTVERILDLLSWPDLNEFKHSSIPR